MKPIPETFSADELLEKSVQRINQAFYRMTVGVPFTEGEPIVKEDMSNLTVNEILEKIKEFNDSNPIDEHYKVFLHYLAQYPVSMCKRRVSHLLKFLIGFHYRYGQMLKEEHFKTVKPVSMEELAQIFGRSKATIHECIKDTEGYWKEFLELMEKEKEIETKAERELIEEAKERLRKEKLNSEEKTKQNEGTNERTLATEEREVYSS